tara:strand:- start:1016 stop:1297 length:282 start_codon:yes stop_codon:yes gene_type:complete
MYSYLPPHTTFRPKMQLKRVGQRVFFYYMDISITRIDKTNRSLKPLSVHGMLWLQTHFENEQWEALSSNRVIISETDSKLLTKDANLAGINIV